MSKKISVTFICDICKRESTEGSFLHSATIPVKKEGSDNKYGYVHMDICEDCQEMLLNAVQKHFAKVVIKNEQHIETVSLASEVISLHGKSNVENENEAKQTPTACCTNSTWEI